MEESISFFSETDFEFSKSDVVAKWINDIALEFKYSISSLNYIFCSDEYLLDINRKYLNHDYYTDIITFDNSDEASSIESDIYISIDRVQENANTFNILFEKELFRVIIHGVLHLVGFEDHTDEEKALMRSKEEYCLSKLSF